jgi:hypothetical protein
MVGVQTGMHIDQLLGNNYKFSNNASEAATMSVALPLVTAVFSYVKAPIEEQSTVEKYWPI